MRLLKIHTLDLDKKYCDRDTIMLHACFQIFSDFMEQEFEHDDRCEETYKTEIKEMEALYTWWKNVSVLELDYEVAQQQLERLIKLRKFLWV